MRRLGVFEEGGGGDVKLVVRIRSHRCSRQWRNQTQKKPPKKKRIVWHEKQQQKVIGSVVCRRYYCHHGKQNACVVSLIIEHTHTQNLPGASMIRKQTGSLPKHTHTQNDYTCVLLGVLPSVHPHHDVEAQGGTTTSNLVLVQCHHAFNSV